MRVVKEWAKANKSGFTIVELLIVIVVIGILAAIVIVAYNGIQDRAKWSNTQSGLSAVNKAILAYHAVNGSYPVVAAPPGWAWRYSCSTGITNFIPELNSDYPNLPQAPCTSATLTNDTWIYGSDGVEYKLMHIRPAFADTIDSTIPTSLRDWRWTATVGTWGYWSAGAAGR